MVQVKHLNTLGVEQVAAAIHTQGLGLADNAVNVAYQFLARKFTLLSQAGPLVCSSADCSELCCTILARVHRVPSLRQRCWKIHAVQYRTGAHCQSQFRDCLQQCACEGLQEGNLCSSGVGLVGDAVFCSDRFQCISASRHGVRLAQFLFQDAVRARLGVEARAFAESRSSGEAGPYAMAAAQRVAADFARLGQAPDGLSYLDHLRKLITGAPALPQTPPAVHPVQESLETCTPAAAASSRSVLASPNADAEWCHFTHEEASLVQLMSCAGDRPGTSVAVVRVAG